MTHHENNDNDGVFAFAPLFVLIGLIVAMNASKSIHSNSKSVIESWIIKIHQIHNNQRAMKQ